MNNDGTYETTRYALNELVLTPSYPLLKIDQIKWDVTDLFELELKKPAADTRTTLLSKLDVIRGMLEKKNLSGAHEKLRDDILVKTDGF